MKKKITNDSLESTFAQLQADVNKKHWFERQDAHLQSALKEALKITNPLLAIECAQLLVQKGANLHWRLQDAPLLLSLQRKDDKVLRWMMEQGVDVQAPVYVSGGLSLSKKDHYSYPLWLAAGMKNSAALKILLKSCSDIQMPSDCATTEFMRFGNGKCSLLGYCLLDIKNSKISDASCQSALTVLEHIKKTHTESEYKQQCQDAFVLLMDLKHIEYVHASGLRDAQWSKKQLELVAQLLPQVQMDLPFKALIYDGSLRHYTWKEKTAWDQMERMTSAQWWHQTVQSSAHLQAYVQALPDSWWEKRLRQEMEEFLDNFMDKNVSKETLLSTDESVKDLCDRSTKWLGLMQDKERMQAFLSKNQYVPNMLGAMSQKPINKIPMFGYTVSNEDVQMVSINGGVKKLKLQEDQDNNTGCPWVVYAKVNYECAKLAQLPYNKEQYEQLGSIPMSLVQKILSPSANEQTQEEYDSFLEQWSLTGNVKMAKPRIQALKRV